MKHLLFIIFIFASGYYYWNTRPISHGPGEIVTQDPIQKNAFGVDPFDHERFRIEPLARYEMKARVISKKQYKGDIQSELSPFDIVVGWGPMSDSRNLDYILIKQSNRDYRWEVTNPPIPETQMRQHSANIHLVPPNEAMLQKLKDLREGHIINIKGYLIKASAETGWTLKSSLSRTDTGSSSSELVWLEEFEIVDA